MGSNDRSEIIEIILENSLAFEEDSWQELDVIKHVSRLK